MPDTPSNNKFNRRQALGLIVVTAGGGAFMPAIARAQSGSPYAGAALLMPEAGVCTITPETTEGPFYFHPELERADITDGREGLDLVVRLQVVDEQCRPIEGARVDLWHCDATGHYSGYPGQGDDRSVDTTGQKFLRGWQRSGADGIVSFQTIYPGWYRGRTTHIHFKVYLDDRSVMTGQMFFPDDLSDHIFATLRPYSERQRRRDTLNADDRILADAGPSAQSAVREAAKNYEALMIVAIKPA